MKVLHRWANQNRKAGIKLYKKTDNEH